MTTTTTTPRKAPAMKTRAPFTPKDFGVGDTVVWTHEYADGRRDERIGQVWALAPTLHASPTVWVLADDTGMAVAVVKLRKGGRVYTAAGHDFRAGDIFSESSAMAPTGSVTIAAERHAYNTRTENARRAAVVLGVAA